MRKLLAIAGMMTLAGCSSIENCQGYGNKGANAWTEMKLAEAAFAESFSTKGASIEMRLGLTVGKTSLSEIMTALPKVFNSPTECDRWLERWALSAPDINYNVSCEELNAKYLYSAIPVKANGVTSWPLPRNGIRISQASQTLDSVLEASFRRVSRSCSADRIPDLEMLRDSEDKKWVDESIYWLTYLASTWPEHLSSAEFGRKKDEANKLMWGRMLLEDSEREHKIHFFGEDGLVRPCFEWSANPSYTLPLSEQTIWYYIGLRDQVYEPGLTRETALFWAVVLTVHFKSTYGAERLREFRDKHAINPDSTFWKEASRATQSLTATDEKGR